MNTYCVLIEHSDEGKVWLHAPDIPGFATNGDTLKNAIARFEAFAVFHLEAHDIKDLINYPERRTADEIRKSGEADGFDGICEVEVDFSFPEI